MCIYNTTMNEAMQRERKLILSLSRTEAIEYIAWRYRRTREVHMAHNMTDIEIDQVAIQQYERIINGNPYS